jgi:dTDP-4-dehydrorhamnose reductase
MRILVTGRQGQVVQALVQRGAETGFDIKTISRPELDMADPAQTRHAMRAAIAAFQPQLIINAAAYTAVDQAEDEPGAAFAINALSACEMAAAAKDAGLPIIQISTDYVFDGTKDGPYLETDTPNPQSVYGHSKLAGEGAVRAANPQHLIFRTAWVYSPFGKNFVKTMLHLAQTRDEISVVADQFGNPTSAFDIAEGILAAARRYEADAANMPWGTFHLAGPDAMNWAEFAARIFTASAAKGGPSAKVKPVTTADYPTKAKRPANSRLDSSRFALAFGWQAVATRDMLDMTIAALMPDDSSMLKPHNTG